MNSTPQVLRRARKFYSLPLTVNCVFFFFFPLVRPLLSFVQFHESVQLPSTKRLLSNFGAASLSPVHLLVVRPPPFHSEAHPSFCPTDSLDTDLCFSPSPSNWFRYLDFPLHMIDPGIYPSSSRFRVPSGPPPPKPFQVLEAPLFPISFSLLLLVHPLSESHFARFTFALLLPPLLCR